MVVSFHLGVRIVALIMMCRREELSLLFRIPQMCTSQPTSVKTLVILN